MKSQIAGFSVIELMIVLVLFALIITKAIPFTMDWINSARVTETESILIEAMGLTKAKSLRNANGVIDGKAVAALCLSNNQVAVVEATDNSSPANCADANTRVWRAELANNISVLESGNSFSCLCMDSKAQMTSLDACALCSAASSFTLTAGGISESVEVY